MSVGAAFDIDCSQIFALANRLQGAAPLIIRDELTTGMNRATVQVQKYATARIKHKSGALGRGFKRQVRVSSNAILGIVSNTAKHAKWVEFGRGPVVAKRAKVLRFEIDGQVLFRKSVGPAAAQHFMSGGLRDAEGAIMGEFRASSARIIQRVSVLR